MDEDRLHLGFEENKTAPFAGAAQNAMFTLQFQTARGIAIPIPRLRGEGSSRCLKPRPRAPPGTLNHVDQG